MLEIVVGDDYRIFLSEPVSTANLADKSDGRAAVSLRYVVVIVRSVHQIFTQLKGYAATVSDRHLSCDRKYCMYMWKKLVQKGFF